MIINTPLLQDGVVDIIKRPSGDKNKTVKVNDVRQPANFIVQYVDDSEGPHCLTLDKYGKEPLA